MDQMIILVDQDRVLVDFEGGLIREWKRRFPNEYFEPFEKGIVFVNDEEFPDHLRSKVLSIYSAPNFFRSLPPVAGGIEAIREMKKLGINVQICTSSISNYENCVLEKYQWVEHNLGREWTKKIILTRDKTMIRGDVLIDDKPEIRGVLTPEWEHLLFECPYNLHVVGKRRINWSNWREALGI